MKPPPVAGRLKLARIAAGYRTAKSFAEKHQIPQPTYALHESGKRDLTNKVAERYAQLLGVTIEWLLFGRGAGPGAPPELSGIQAAIGEVPVVGKVEAGAWAAAIRWEDDQVFFVSAPFDPRYAHCRKFGLIARGRSMDLVYRDGTILICVDLVEFGADPQPGQHVICQRRDVRSDLVEATVKEYVVEGGRHFLWPRSTAPDHQQPIELNPSDGEDDAVRMVSLVIGAYQPAP